MATINDLPNEMLEHIFEVMDCKTLKSSIGVCKNWQKLISSSPKAMEKFKLVFEMSEMESMVEDMRKCNENCPDSDFFDRKYQAMNIVENVEWGDETLPVLQKIGAHLRVLELSNCSLYFEQGDDFGKILCSLPRLETLKIYDTMTDTNDAETELPLLKLNPVTMPSIKFVVLHQSGLDFLQLFKNNQLKSFKMSGEEILSELSHHKVLMAFLASQTQLEELALRNIYCFEEVCDFKDEIKKISFPLKRLSLHKMGKLLGSEANALEFMEKIVNTMEELELGSGIYKSIYELVFNKYSKLKVLNIFVKFVPQDANFYNTLRPNNAVKKLIIQRYDEEREVATQGIIRNVPNVEVLVLTCNVKNETLICASNSLQMLHTLHLHELPSGLFKNVTLPNVKALFVETMATVYIKDWNLIIRAMPNIEKLCIANVTQMLSLTDKIFGIFTNAWNLKHISLGHGFVPNKLMFYHILRNCPSIKTVKVMSSSLKKSQRVAGILRNEFKKDGLRFVMGERPYDDNVFVEESKKSLWDGEECQEEFDDESDYDEDSDEELNEVEIALLGHLLQNAFGMAPDDSDEDRQNYFDSDGEMRFWDEDPSDYGYGDFDGFF